MKGIIIYKGKYGATQQYARWLGNELDLPVVSADNFPGEGLEKYNFLLIGSSVYAGKLQISKWLKKNLQALKNKKIYLFQVAATPPGEKAKLQSYFQSGVPAEIIKNCEVHFLQGKMKVRELSWKDRFLLKMGAWLTNDPATKRAMLTDFNNVRIENLDALLNSVRKFYSLLEKKLQFIK